MSISYGPIILAAAAFGAGLTSAWYWYGSARVEFRRPPATPFGPLDLNDPMAREPILPEQKPGWYAYWQRTATDALALAAEQNWNAMVDANREMGRLNQIAARWTAAAVLLGTASSVWSALGGA
ncbi:hypothetical protein BamIOP4010DRAFT_3007 [Burkholderia ambifaria IOP40-10]|uniref:Transmembrane protein n=1 Tax=Burkholderia ambifaria IOP40-10 TaxID=396596 RepID=B1FG47_9BURK|nr:MULTISPECIES: hypothetical protein [Burkholderia]EDT03478.1 hypothetical protein BamIOP4010DRAFT_3007 [Burkholderia ambifaria IOP40-10]PRE06057.1 hypothetical protein C6P91_10335 [Burkholderia multivorans]